ncbi:putative hydroxypyruvate isomerase [Liolophura sinensis]|uniref:putative hydroxypyruvate isomerase n=1 Tax=Liolophura sinensis TaxID=3198878 RepID=UPI003158CA8C
MSSKMPLKFAANLSMMFTEFPTLAERYEAAKDAGFKYVEATFPYGEDAGTLAEARRRAGLEHVLINGWPGELSAGDLGIAALRSRKLEFVDKLEMSIKYANALNCKRMHIMAGKRPEAEEDVYLENIKYAADRLQKEGILALIEAVNSKLSAPGYFMDEPERGLEYVKKINHPNLKFQFDFFHVQIMSGNLTENLKKFLPHIGHIQISQVPDRGEPDDQGEITYPYIFRLLQELGYDGYVGLEYKPRGTTLEGLQWLEKAGCDLTL